MKHLRILGLSIGITAALLSCGDDDSDVQPGNPQDSTDVEMGDPTNPDSIGDPAAADVNDWIFNTLDFWYFWRTELPTDQTREQDPNDYFNSLIFSGDRFSILVPDYQTLINSLDGVVLEAGYEIAAVRESENSDVVLAAVTYVKANSPAQNAGLRRGDFIESVNGTKMNTSNFADVLSDISEDHTIEYRRYNDTFETFQTLTASLGVVQITENPHFLDTVYTFQNGTKVGYYVYQFFAPGVGSGTEYDDQMDQIFANFKAEGIDELILDLRYNGGGSVSSATNLASLIAPGVNDTDILYRNDWNDVIEDVIENDPSTDPEEFFIGNFRNKAENIGSQLASDRIYVLVGRGTASASELIINGLTPYMDVIIIGETTVGKNVGSIALEDTVSTGSQYGMLPIVFQIENSLGQSDYANGFTPGGLYQVNDIQVPLRTLGDSREPLLNTAFADISGVLVGRRRPSEGLQTIITSRQLQPARNELIFDNAEF